MKFKLLLSFLAAILLSEGEKRAVTDPWYLVAVAVGTLCCGWITYSAGRALLRMCEALRLIRRVP